MVGNLASRSVYRGNNNNAMSMFLFSVIGLSLLSSVISATLANAQPSSSDSTSGTDSTSNRLDFCNG